MINLKLYKICILRVEITTIGIFCHFYCLQTFSLKSWLVLELVALYLQFAKSNRLIKSIY